MHQNDIASMLFQDSLYISCNMHSYKSFRPKLFYLLLQVLCVWSSQPASTADTHTKKSGKAAQEALLIIFCDLRGQIKGTARTFISFIVLSMRYGQYQ